MIDHKSLRIFLLFLLAMIASAVWRLSLPDWLAPAGGSAGHDMIDGLFLFLSPVCLLFFLVSPLIQWLASPSESRPSVRRYNDKVIVAWCVFWGLFQAFVLARSLDLVSLSNVGMARGASMVIGVIFLIFGNFAPKMPVPQQPGGLPTESWRTSRQLRLIGKLFVCLGLAFVIGGILLPLEYWQPVFLPLMLATLAAGIWYCTKIRHEPLL